MAASVPRPVAAVTALAVAFLAVLAPVAADCECGYSTTIDDGQYVFTDLIETDFTRLADIGTNTDWVRQEFNISRTKARGSFGEMFAVSNIYTETGSGQPGAASRASGANPAGLQLVVRAEQVEDMVPVAEIDTARLDVVFGSYRAGLKLTDVPGTCSAFFWYFNDTQEIDMEFLSKDFDRARNSYPVNLVLQSREAAERGFDAQQTGNFVKAFLPFDPTDGVHEYRIDFLPGRVRFYADNRPLAAMGGPAVPDHAGHLVLQHWSNGNPLWSGGPPPRDASTTVAYVKAYFNSSAPRRHADWARRCADAAAPGAVCRIPDSPPRDAGSGPGRTAPGHAAPSAAAAGGGQTPAGGPPPVQTPATGWFFSVQPNMTNNQTISGTADAGGGSEGTPDANGAPATARAPWGALVPALLLAAAWILVVEA